MSGCSITPARETGLQATGSAILSPTARVLRQGLVSRERGGQGKPFES